MFPFRTTSRSNPLLREGAEAHYREPEYYTKSYRGRRHDVAFYVELAERLGGPVLEYGCGNGRICMEIARRGVAITGVDLSESMLADLRDKLEVAPAVVRDHLSIRHGDMRKLRLKKKFNLVLCTFNTFLHLYDREDVEQFLASVRAHLAPKGRLVFDVSMPSPVELARDPERPYRIPPMRWPASGEMVRYAEYFDYDAASQVLLVTMQFEPVDAPERMWSTPLAHRQFYPREIEALLHYNGFEVESVRSDFEHRALDRDADAGVWTAKLARRRRAARP